MTSDTLPQVLGSINWHSNIATAFADVPTLKEIESALMRIAQWASQLETADRGNPALSFVREMQVSAHQCCALIGLCIYKASAASARSMFETLLYYSYFRSHPSELATLARVDKYYVDKSDVIEYHKLHTWEFGKRQEAFGLIGNLEKWYSKVSAIVHGQIPGAWNAHGSLDSISFSEETHKLAVEAFLQAETLAHHFLLCTSGRELWFSFSPAAKINLLKGLSGEKKMALGLDAK